MKNILEYVWYRYVGAIGRLFPVKPGRIVFSNFYGKGYADNPKYIAEEFIKKNNNDIQLIWLIKGEKRPDIPENIKQVKRGTILEIYYLSTANVWIDNCRKYYGIVKKKGQYYVQTWHGGIGLKRCEKDICDTFSKTYLKSAINDSKMADLFLSNSLWQTELYRRCFWYDGKVLQEGLPREDFLVNKKLCNTFRNKYKISADTSLILYAPTFRDDGSLSYYNIDYNRLIDNVKRRFGLKKVCVMVRYHPNIKERVGTSTEGVIDVSDYSDINDLIVESEMLITDYSSCMFDGLIANKKVILYANDLEDFINNGRGFLFELSELPFSIAKTNDELEQIILDFDENQFENNVNSFFDKCGIVSNGNSSRKVVEYIINNYLKKNNI